MIIKTKKRKITKTKKRKKRTDLNKSGDIPHELQDEIIKRLPVKSLLRFRSISKRWRALIDSSKFITDHNVNQTQPHHLLVIHCYGGNRLYSEHKYVSIVDDDSFPRGKLPLKVKSVWWHSNHTVIVGWSHGLVCLYNLDWYPSEIVIWNPSIRKYVGITLEYSELSGLGFGVCPKTFDVKLVKIKLRSQSHYEARVYTLRLGAWRNISINLPRIAQHVNDVSVTIDGIIYWLVKEESFGRWIISFDLKTEEFREVYLPDNLAGSKCMSISRCNESLAILDYDDSSGDCDVWMMYENGVSSSSFIKLFTVNVFPSSIIGFRKNGHLILRHYLGDGRYLDELQAYDPVSKRMRGIGIFDTVFEMASYTETLLLLNHSDSSNARNIYGTDNNFAAGPPTKN